MGFRTLEIGQAAELHIKEGQLEVAAGLTDLLALQHLADTQVHLEEVVDGNGGLCNSYAKCNVKYLRNSRSKANICWK